MFDFRIFVFVVSIVMVEFDVILGDVNVFVLMIELFGEILNIVGVMIVVVDFLNLIVSDFDILNGNNNINFGMVVGDLLMFL